MRKKLCRNCLFLRIDDFDYIKGKKKRDVRWYDCRCFLCIVSFDGHEMFCRDLNKGDCGKYIEGSPAICKKCKHYSFFDKCKIKETEIEWDCYYGTIKFIKDLSSKNKGDCKYFKRK